MPNVFPALRTGVYTQFPYVSSRRFDVTVEKMESGVRYSSYNDAVAFASWELHYSAVSDAEALALRTFFLLVGGSYDVIQFTDLDTGIVYPNCRFNQDTLEVTATGPNQNSFRLLIEEFR